MFQPFEIYRFNTYMLPDQWLYEIRPVPGQLRLYDTLRDALNLECACTQHFPPPHSLYIYIREEDCE